ncbi:MAG TPA: hypothetical protein VGJ48_06835 [Pyrinomonadaceae bacterium]
MSLTLKAFTNSSPGFALKPWGISRTPFVGRNSERVATAFSGQRRNFFRVASSMDECLFPGLPKLNPGLELANAFSVTFLIAKGQT